MMRRLNREEMKTYLENRKKKGFNVIQAMVISEFIHADKPTNYYGVQQFIDEDPERPAITPGNNLVSKMNTISGIISIMELNWPAAWDYTWDWLLHGESGLSHV
jgi:hypothetical protein